MNAFDMFMNKMILPVDESKDVIVTIREKLLNNGCNTLCLTKEEIDELDKFLKKLIMVYPKSMKERDLPNTIKLDIDRNTFLRRYCCTCGKTIGKMHDGEICPHCLTKVEYHDIPR